ncbi:MAG: DUF960 domain-containing protein [Eubacteriales bacterium]|nr:DUF960 domain-containing protein [Eubacteriales bacterium]
MFDNQHYATKGVCERIHPLLQVLLWDMIQELPVDRDYLQVFSLSENNGMQRIVHSQEEPEYTREYLINSGTPVFIGKIFVIDDQTHSTMLLAEEY